MTSITNIDLNLSQVNCAVVVYAKQNDKLARHIAATLYDGAAAWTPPAGSYPIIRFLKPDGTAGFYDVDENGDPATTISGNVATMTIVEQAMTVPGDVYMELNFYNAAGEKLTSLKWLLRVQASVLTDATIISTDYYNVLSAQIAAVLGATANPPYIDSSTKNWMIWDEDLGQYVDSGYSSVGLTGPYFTPSVSAAGDISWTNNGNLPNPTTQNIKGPQGVSIASTSKASGTGAPGTTDVYNVNLSNNTVGGTFNVYNGSDGQGSPGTQTPLMDGTAAVGSATAYSREDHVHPTDTSRAAATALADYLKIDGSSVSIWNDDATKDLNNFSTGLVIINGDYVQHAPSNNTWWVVFSGGNSASVCCQVAFPLWYSAVPRTRYLASNTWSAWTDLVADPRRAAVGEVAYSAIDSITESGLYKVTGTASTLLHITWDSIYSFQLIQYHGSFNVFIRSSSSLFSGWSAWRQLGFMPKTATITLSTSWSGSDPYTQTVTISGATITANTKVDIQLGDSALAQLINDGVSAIYIENNNGTLTAHAVGGYNSTSISAQVTYYETA